MSNHDDEDHRGPRLSYNCDRGPAFRTFKRDFFALARGRFAKDDRYSFFQAWLALDTFFRRGNSLFPETLSGTGMAYFRKYFRNFPTFLNTACDRSSSACAVRASVGRLSFLLSLPSAAEAYIRSTC